MKHRILSLSVVALLLASPAIQPRGWAGVAPEQMRDTEPSGALLSLMVGLSGDPSTEVVLNSGRDRTSSHNWFAWLPIGLAAEHGVWRASAAPNGS